MSAEFSVGQCHNLSGVGIFISGKVEFGEVIEGSVGRTLRGKKFTLVKIEKEGFQTSKIQRKEKANLLVKNITREDIRPGEVIYFE